MTMQTEAPDFPPYRTASGRMSGPYPSGGKVLGPAWQDVWAILLRDPKVFLDGWVIAEEVAPKYEMSPLSVVQLLSRAAEAGLLERAHKNVTTSITRVHKGVPTTRQGVRLRSHYRIKP